MKILILGGTRFLGRAFVEEALKEGMKLHYLIAERIKKFFLK